MKLSHHREGEVESFERHVVEGKRVEIASVFSDVSEFATQKKVTPSIGKSKEKGEKKEGRSVILRSNHLSKERDEKASADHSKKWSTKEREAASDMEIDDEPGEKGPIARMRLRELWKFRKTVTGFAKGWIDEKKKVVNSVNGRKLKSAKVLARSKASLLVNKGREDGHDDISGDDGVGLSGGLMLLWEAGLKEKFMLEKLDRCLANSDWVNLFPQSRAFYLEWWCSDHKALVLDTEGGRDSNDGGKALRSRFHFEEAWVEEEECSDIVREGWNTLDPCSSDWDFKSKTQRCGSRLNSWNTKKKKELQHRVKEGTKRAICCEDDAEIILGIQQGSSKSEDRLIWHFAKNGEYNVRSGNLSLHNNFSPKSEDVIAVATRILEEYQSNHGRRSPKTNTPAPERKRWAPPDCGTLLFNVDAAVNTTNKSSSAGGVLRDHKGSCVMSFRQYWHFPFNPYVAELKAIKEAILIAGNRNLRDCLNAVKAINSSYVLDRDVEFLLEDIKKGLLSCNFLGVNYVPRTCNSLADYLAKNALVVKDSLVWDGGVPPVAFSTFSTSSEDEDSD
ncbi:hypothetical protein G4B88_029474 [Cannabis sativa]|uniref:RNase H type-1 domain-containing protein n=1 Tax=Cannabis sativa TaxID=3483 RepID=A0A7J6FFK5_CANSA|nr:hypothetical protein G4B88_029474 [Cannabis sativa]